MKTAYECVSERELLSTSRHSSGRIEVVYLHKATDTYWRTGYEVRLDDSDAHLSTRWEQVRPREVVTIVFNSLLNGET